MSVTGFIHACAVFVWRRDCARRWYSRLPRVHVSAFSLLCLGACSRLRFFARSLLARVRRLRLLFLFSLARRLRRGWSVASITASAVRGCCSECFHCRRRFPRLRRRRFEGPALSCSCGSRRRPGGPVQSCNRLCFCNSCCSCRRRCCRRRQHHFRRCGCSFRHRAFQSSCCRRLCCFLCMLSRCFWLFCRRCWLHFCPCW